MAIELNLAKSDNESWGFRVTGGVEYGVPLTVVKVTEDSLAEKSGLKCQDVIARVNNVATADLTHSETHDLIISAGNSLILVVERPLFELNSSELCDEEANAEVCNIMQSSLEAEQHLEHKQEQLEVINPPDDYRDTEELPIVEFKTTLPQNQDTHQNGNISPNNQRKWSTFLQKPSNPKPVEKKKDESQTGEPYRVIIRKQKKKSSTDLENTIKNNQPQDDKCEENNDKYEDVTHETHKVTTDEQTTFRAEIRDVEEISPENENYENDNIPMEEVDSENVSKNIQGEKNPVMEKILEEKLAEVQKQLEALSKLPLTIQSTIDAVTKQIASIVSAAGGSLEESEEKALSEISSENDVAEQVITEESDVSSNELEQQQRQQQDEENTGEDEQELDTGNTYQVEEESNIKKNICEDNQIEEQIQELDPDEGLTEEEKEAKRIEREMQEKQQKECEQLEEFKQRRLKQKPTLPLKPIERPIILPGGRRWSQPDDACPAVRNPKMTDEKIANTIETYSEVIIGKTKGFAVFRESNCGMVPSSIISTKNINFLKYQPPPKNLDYLHRSDVYKMVHDLEPPVRGISSRASKILSEQDYYQTG